MPVGGKQRKARPVKPRIGTARSRLNGRTVGDATYPEATNGAKVGLPTEAAKQRRLERVKGIEPSS